MQQSDSQIEQKQQGPEEKLKDEKSQKLVEQPYREFVITDLKSWTFKMHVNDREHEYTARNCPVEHWIFYFSNFAFLDPKTDWTDLEERADFLAQLWLFCYEQKLSFPLAEILT